VTPAAKNLRVALFPRFKSHPHIGDFRGLGLLLGVEFVKDKALANLFLNPKALRKKSRQACLEESVLTYPHARLLLRRARRSHSSSTRPSRFSPEESELIARALQSALEKVFPS